MKTKDIALTAIGIASYVCLSMAVKTPIVGHISLDLGYIVLAVYCYIFGSISGAIVGFSGAFLVSLISTGWIGIEWSTGNLIIGFICGTVYRRTQGKKYAAPICIATTIASVFLGVAIIKTVLACLIYSMPFGIKFAKNLVAFTIDAVVMCIGYLSCMKNSNLSLHHVKE